MENKILKRKILEHENAIRRANGPTACQTMSHDVVFNRFIDFFDNWPPPWGPRVPKCARRRRHFHNRAASWCFFERSFSILGRPFLDLDFSTDLSLIFTRNLNQNGSKIDPSSDKLDPKGDFWSSPFSQALRPGADPAPNGPPKPAKINLLSIWDGFLTDFGWL